MTHDHLKSFIDSAYEHAVEITPRPRAWCATRWRRRSICSTGRAARRREAATANGSSHQWLKKAMLLSFRLQRTACASTAAPAARAVVGQGADQIRRAGRRKDFKEAGFRAVPGAVVRRSAYIAPDVVLMPSLRQYRRLGRRAAPWSTPGPRSAPARRSASNVHLSGGAGIGGVLEPLQANPAIIEDNCFIGARSEVAEGVIVGEGSVLSMGVYLGQSTKIIDRATGDVHQGRVPPYSVVVSGAMPGKPLPNGRRALALLRRDRQDASTSAPAPRPRSTSCSGIDSSADRRRGRVPPRSCRVPAPSLCSRWCRSTSSRAPKGRTATAPIRWR